jgi:hypothetical protein
LFRQPAGLDRVRAEARHFFLYMAVSPTRTGTFSLRGRVARCLCQLFGALLYLGNIIAFYRDRLLLPRGIGAGFLGVSHSYIRKVTFSRGTLATRGADG